MVERDDEDDERTFRAFSALRHHVVALSADFGQRLAVRFLALAAARDLGDPSLVEVIGGSLAEGAALVLVPFTERADEGTEAEGEASPPPSTEEHDDEH